MKALILIDSFKGTLTSKELGQITKEELVKKNIDSDYYPISDGGDGFLDAVGALKPYTRIDLKTVDAFNREIDSYYLADSATNTAIIELSKSCGINLVKKEELNPFIATTYGLGLTILDAIKRGYKNVVIGIGGSATNDGGSGMLEALGLKFYSGDKLLHVMNNEKLGAATIVDTSNLLNNIKGVNFLVMSDVTNPLLGIKGATYVFSPQKGAKQEDLPKLESNIKNFKDLSISALGRDYSDKEGTGAAGGVGFALMAYLGAKMTPGIDYLLNEIKKLDLSSYDTIISGEGKIDSQSLDGKVISGIMKHFPGRRIVLVCAINELNDLNYEVYSIVPKLTSKEESLANPKECYRKLIASIFNKYQGVIFDLDGTLLNTIDDLTDGINKAIEIVECEKVTTDEAKYLVGSGVDNLIKNLIKLRGLDEALFSELKERYMYYYGLLKKNKTKPYEGICELLLELKRRNIKIAVFSNKPDIDTQGVIDYYFNGIFDVVVGKRDNVEIKPSSSGAKPILDYFDLPLDKILYVGDTLVDMKTAQNIGASSVGALWGFRTKEELIEGKATYLANCPLEILGIIEEK